jgi:hypothetical protein
MYNLADMTPENVSVAQPQPEGMGEFSRLTGVFFEPKKTFEDIARRPRWIVPMVVVMLAALASTFIFSQRIGWDRFMRQQIESSSRTAQMTAEQREQAVAMQTRFAPIGAVVFIVIGLPLVVLLEAAILLGIVAGIMSAPVKLKQVYAVLWYSSLTTVISAILSIVLMYIKNPDDYNLQNPLAFNPAAFMDPLTTSKFVYSLSSSLDLFSFWTIFLVATGLQAAAGKKLSFGGALTAVILPWAVYVLVKSALAGAFS